MFAPAKLITCIIPMGSGLPVLKALREEKGIDATNINFARGVGRFVRWNQRRLGDDAQKEILTITVAPERADEIFEWVFHKANLDRPHGGIIYMMPLTHASAFSIPHDLEESLATKSPG
jgi:nitrogen regulatory protein PII